MVLLSTASTWAFELLLLLEELELEELLELELLLLEELELLLEELLELLSDFTSASASAST